MSLGHVETEVKCLCVTEAVLSGSCSTADVLGDVFNLLEHLMDKKEIILLFPALMSSMCFTHTA